MSKKITAIEKDYSQWYIDVIMKAKLADYSPVKGCMVIRPNGYAIWENIKSNLDMMFKQTGHKNAYFPIFIPESFLQKEADHLEGFAPETAVVTKGGGKDLQENLIVRPTSETIIWAMYKKWIQSYRDLPLLINQWANVVRWEMRTRLFLRTTEFLWQEGHTAHETYDEAEEETLTILNVYKKFAEEYMAMPVLTGVKTKSQTFPGASRTYCIEAMMQDKKALQAGTSHNLGQNFAKVFDVKYQDRDGNQQYVWASSWGVSTRLIGGLIMTHSDNRGLVLPPKLAQTKIVLIPIYKSEEEKREVFEFGDKIVKDWNSLDYEFDKRENYKPGWKFAEWEQKGIPIRIEIGPRDVKENQVVLVKRFSREKEFVKVEKLTEIPQILEQIQKDMFSKALKFQQDNTFEINNYSDMKDLFSTKDGFAWANWCGDPKCEEQIQEETKATIRLIPRENFEPNGKCVFCNNEGKYRVVFAKAY